MPVLTGLERLIAEADLQQSIRGQIGLLAHNASVTFHLDWAPLLLKKIFGKRLTKLFGPQHGFFANVQDNMIETPHDYNPFLDLKIYSLYGETRWPTPEMLEGLDTLIVDLQDVGTRVYTYIYTLTYIMEACAKQNVEVVILDRPNPAGGDIIEGNLLDLEFSSFVGRHPLPMRHSLTLGELALWAKAYVPIDCPLKVIPMQGWERHFSFSECGLPWVNPSPNLAHPDSAFIYPGSVLFEGTTISEGRGTTRALEVIGHPALDPFLPLKQFQKEWKEMGIEGVVLRPHYFIPTFHKFQGQNCGGWQIHVLNHKLFRSWRMGQVLLQYLYHHLISEFQWKQPPYEYELHRLPIDMINGTDQLRLWVEKKGSIEDLIHYEKKMLEIFLPQRENSRLY